MYKSPLFNFPLETMIDLVLVVRLGEEKKAIRVACVAGGIRERESERESERQSRHHIPSWAKPAREFPACHILYGFCLPPTFITFDNPIT